LGSIAGGAYPGIDNVALVAAPGDSDGDSIPDDTDNCPTTANADQADTDADGQGDACDPDDDGDGILDGADNCLLSVGAENDQADDDNDGIGDQCMLCSMSLP
jgi:hypothetical protein